MTTYEEATHCPRCGEAGREIKKEPGPRRSTIHAFICENERCRWYKTGWVVQELSDGSIPDAVTKGPKSFEPLSPDQEAYARRQLEDLAFHDPAAAEAVRKTIEERG